MQVMNALLTAIIAMLMRFSSQDSKTEMPNNFKIMQAEISSSLKYKDMTPTSFHDSLGIFVILK
jgi:hypothetical protein